MRDWRKFCLELYTFIRYLLKKNSTLKKTIHMIDKLELANLI